MVVKIQWVVRKGDRAGRLACRAMCEWIVTESKGGTRRVGRGCQDVITTTGTGVVCDWWTQYISEESTDYLFLNTRMFESITALLSCKPCYDCKIQNSSQNISSAGQNAANIHGWLYNREPLNDQWAIGSLKVNWSY